MKDDELIKANRLLLGARIKSERERLKLTQGELAKVLGLKNKSSISQYESGDTVPNDDIKLRMCQLFGCNIDYLIGKSPIRNDSEAFFETVKRIKELYGVTSSRISPFDIDIASHYRPEYNPTLEASLDLLEPKKNTIKVYSQVHAGILDEMIEYIVDTEEIDEKMLKGGKEFFGVKVKGDSMSPKYLEGDTIIVEKTDNCENGQDCVFSVNGNEAFLKRVYKNENGIILQALNSNYPPITYTNKDISSLPVTIIGIVRELRRKI